ncbi:MAG: electron transfer flavoprotein subunit beta/FixA family protein [Planctomycetes bacterium]|nr:electron transfer flavoprotein subunit beta/FixA family protein [Planctomycetota bacterium]
MKICVCVKRVPATTTRVAVGENNRIDPSGVEFVLNPYDELAVEQALKVKEAGEGTVSAFCFGSSNTQKEMRTVLAMGADDATLLQNDDAPHADGATTAKVLAEALKDGGYDLIFFGKQAVDRDQHGVGPAVATMLGIPCITEAISFELQGDKVVCEREVEGGRETVEAPLPCAVTCMKGLNEPRFASLKGIMAAKRKPLNIVETAMESAAVEVVELAMPPARPAGRIVGEGATAVPELVAALRNEAKVL